jgi:hypothetical protein
MVMKLIRAAYLTAQQYKELFTKAGYTEIEIFEENKKGWICGVGRRSAMSDEL